MSETEYVTSIDVAGVQTEGGDFHDVSVEIYHSWVKISDDTGTRWVPRDIVVEIFELD